MLKLKIKSSMRFPIAIKLIVLTICLLVLVTSLIALKSSSYFEKEVKLTHERSNQQQVADRALQVEALIQGYVDKLKTLGPLLQMPYEKEQMRERVLDIAFRPDKDLVALEIYSLLNGTIELTQRLVQTDYLMGKGFSEAYIFELRGHHPPPLESVFQGNVEIFNSSIENGIPLLTVGLPLIRGSDGTLTHVVIADFKLEKIQKAFASRGATEIFLVDKLGRTIAHPNDSHSLKVSDFSSHPLVMESLDSKFKSNHIPLFWNPEDNQNYYGVYSQTSFGPLVVGQIPELIIREPAMQVQHQAIYVGGLILSGSIFLIFLFSMTLTRPIEKLLALTREVSRGNFDVHAAEKVSSKDEVSDLAMAFDQMTVGLKALVKTQGVDVAETLMTTDLEHLGGTKKNVVVLFSDLRDFTKFSEGHSPEEVVEMLNEYFEVMVACIERNKGRVNKFIGDAIMAMWGAPNGTPEDDVLAVQAAIEMRLELEKLNQLRISRKQPPIRIGVGLHRGEAVAGTIGSKSRLEYTIIGDTVNQASRIESSTKAFGTDLLVSHEVADQIQNKFKTELAGAAEVKGKSEPLKMYRVPGKFLENGDYQEIKTPYSEYASEAVDKVKVAS